MIGLPLPPVSAAVTSAPSAANRSPTSPPCKPTSAHTPGRSRTRAATVDVPSPTDLPATSTSARTQEPGPTAASSVETPSPSQATSSVTLADFTMGRSEYIYLYLFPYGAILFFHVPVLIIYSKNKLFQTTKCVILIYQIVNDLLFGSLIIEYLLPSFTHFATLQTHAAKHLTCMQIHAITIFAIYYYKYIIVLDLKEMKT